MVEQVPFNPVEWQLLSGCFLKKSCWSSYFHCFSSAVVHCRSINLRRNTGEPILKNCRVSIPEKKTTGPNSSTISQPGNWTSWPPIWPRRSIHHHFPIIFPSFSQIFPWNPQVTIRFHAASPFRRDAGQTPSFSITLMPSRIMAPASLSTLPSTYLEELVGELVVTTCPLPPRKTSKNYVVRIMCFACYQYYIMSYALSRYAYCVCT